MFLKNTSESPSGTSESSFSLQLSKIRLKFHSNILYIYHISNTSELKNHNRHRFDQNLLPISPTFILTYSPLIAGC